MSTSAPTANTAPLNAPPKTKLPAGIPFIIGNEAAERFSFYGMKNILTFFMLHYLLVSVVPDEEARKGVASSNYHLFVSAVYFFPLLGGYLADRYLGKYRTIFGLSLLYCCGHLCLALFESSPQGFYFGLGLIALGSGGIKPCVSALVGDQFNESNKHLVKGVFGAFYWIINFGSFFATLLIPWTLKHYGPSVAFGIPGILMLIATIILWLGRNRFVHVPPSGANPHAFSKVVKDAVSSKQAREPGSHWLDGAKAKHPDEAVNGAKAVFRLMALFAPVPLFWALFDQKGSTWVLQADKMDRNVFGWVMEPSQIMALNPLFVMLLIPFNQFVLFPFLRRRGWAPSPLQSMGLGMGIAGVAFLIVGGLQLLIDRGESLSLLWQAAPYLVLTFAEVLVSVTGLEFAYSQAPRSMKSILMALWSLTVTFGNLITAFFSRLNVFKGAGMYAFYALLIFAAAGLFALISRRYVVSDQYQPAEPKPS